MYTGWEAGCAYFVQVAAKKLLKQVTDTESLQC